MHFDYYVKVLQKRFLKGLGESPSWENYVSAVRPFARQKPIFPWIKSMRKLVASLESSLYLTESIKHIINVRE